MNNLTSFEIIYAILAAAGFLLGLLNLFLRVMDRRTYLLIKAENLRCREAEQYQKLVTGSSRKDNCTLLHGELHITNPGMRNNSVTEISCMVDGKRLQPLEKDSQITIGNNIVHGMADNPKTFQIWWQHSDNPWKTTEVVDIPAGGAKKGDIAYKIPGRPFTIGEKVKIKLVATDSGGKTYAKDAVISMEEYANKETELTPQ